MQKGDVGDTAFRHEAIRTAYECQSEEVAKAVAQKMVLEKGIKLSGVPLTVTDMRALAFVMKHEEKLTALEYVYGLIILNEYTNMYKRTTMKWPE